MALSVSAPLAKDLRLAGVPAPEAVVVRSVPTAIGIPTGTAVVVVLPIRDCKAREPVVVFTAAIVAPAALVQYVSDTRWEVAYHVVPPSHVSNSTVSTPAVNHCGTTATVPVESHLTLTGKVSANAPPFVIRNQIRVYQLEVGTFVNASVVAWLTVNTNVRANARSQVVVAPTVGLLKGRRGRAISASIVSRSALTSTSQGVSP